MRRWIAALLLLVLCACAEPAQTADAPEVEQTERPLHPYAVETVSDTFRWIGKTAEEIGVNRKHFDYADNIVFTGDLYGHTVGGTAYFAVDPEDPEHAERISEIVVTDGIENLQVTENALSVRCGEPYASGEEPYVEANGGVTLWEDYWTGEGIVSLSHSEKNDIYIFRYTVPKEVPAEIQSRPDVLSAEDLGHATGIYFHFADGEAEDLHIERTAYEGRDAWLLTFEHDRVPYRITIVPGGEELFDTLTANGRFTEISGELLTYRYRAPENSSGVIYEKDAFGDLWIIEPGEPMKPEKMENFADFLLNRWLY